GDGAVIAVHERLAAARAQPFGCVCVDDAAVVTLRAAPLAHADTALVPGQGDGRRHSSTLPSPPRRCQAVQSTRWAARRGAVEMTRVGRAPLGPSSIDYTDRVIPRMMLARGRLTFSNGTRAALFARFG